MRPIRLATAVLLLALPACGQADGTQGSPAGSGGTTPAASAHVTCKPPDHWANNYGGPIMRVNFSATNGISTVNCTFDNPEIYGGDPGATATCATLAAQEQNVPNFHSSSYPYGIDFNVHIETSSFNGAGTYSGDALTVDPMFFTDFTDQFGLVHYQPVTASTASTDTVVINPDGSGSYVFSGYAPDDPTATQPSGKPWPPLSGKVTWTCKDNPSTPTPGS